MSEKKVVESKVKKYIKENGDMNTSASFIDAISAEVERKCKAAIEKARADKRKTVMDRDLVE